MISQIIWRPGQNDPRDCIVLMKGDKVILEPMDLNGFCRGFNSTTGCSGLVPLFAFEGNPVAFDIGSAMVLTDFEREIAQFPSRIVLDSNCWVKSIKQFMSPSRDYQFLLSGVKIIENLHIEFVFGNNSKSVLQILESLVQNAKTAVDSAAEQRADTAKSSRIVFPIPYVWNYYQRLLLRQAALNSGFSNAEFVYQNIATAIHFTKDVSDFGLMLVVSVGASYTDISLLIKCKEKIIELATDGIELGGSDATNLLVSRIREELKLPRFNDSALERQLYNECELGKINLSVMQTVRIPVKPGFDYVLSRENMEEIQSPILKKIVTAIDRCFERAKKHYEDVEKVLLGGDASPILNPFLSKFQREKIAKISAASTTMGAARFAHRNLSRAASGHYFHYGIGIGDGVVTPVLLANETGPKKMNFKILPQRKFVNIDVYEIGYLLVKRNLHLARIKVDWVPFYENLMLQLVLELDNGVLRITVYGGEKLLHHAVINDLDQVMGLKNINLGLNPGLIESIDDIDSQPTLMCAPYRFEISELDTYFNDLLNIHSVSERFSNLVSKDLEKRMAKEFEYHLDLINLWTTTSSSWKIIQGNGLTSLSHVLPVIEELFQSLSQAMAVNEPDFSIIKEIRIGYNSTLVSLDSIPTSDEIRIGRKSMIEFCQHCIHLCDKMSGIFHSVHDSYSPLSNVILSIIKVADNFPLVIPLYISSRLISQTHFYKKSMYTLTEFQSFTLLDKHIRGLIPAEQASYAKLVKVSEETDSYIKQNHRRILQIPLVVSDGQIKPQYNKECFIYEEYLLKVLILLDNIEVHDQVILRTTRKNLVNGIQWHLNQIDNLKSLYKFIK